MIEHFNKLHSEEFGEQTDPDLIYKRLFPYRCRLCAYKRFRLAAHLKAHIKVMHINKRVKDKNNTELADNSRSRSNSETSFEDPWPLERMEKEWPTAIRVMEERKEAEDQYKLNKKLNKSKVDEDNGLVDF